MRGILAPYLYALLERRVNFGSKDDFSELILKRKDGAVYTINLTGLSGHSITIERMQGRTVLEITLRADMSHVRYQGIFGQSRLEKLLPEINAAIRLLGPGDATPSTEKT